jgi:hypothetical protein
MPVAAVFEFPDHPVDDYLKVFEIGGAPIVDQPTRLHHVCYRNGDGFTVVDIWESEQAFAEFGQIVGPVLQRLGLDALPKVFPVQRTVAQDGTVTDF